MPSKGKDSLDRRGRNHLQPEGERRKKKGRYDYYTDPAPPEGGTKRTTLCHGREKEKRKTTTSTSSG